MLNINKYNQIREEVLDFLPLKIIDAHVHTGTRAGEVNPEKQEPHPLSYGIMKNRTLTISLDSFSGVFPDKDIKMVGFPLPLPFEEINPIEWNNKLMIKEMKKGIYGVLHWIRDIDEMEKTIKIAKKNNLKFHGIKFHPRLYPEKEKQTVLISDMINEKILDFAEKNKLTMITELSHEFCKEDVVFLKKIDENYNINIVIPHMGLNYRGFVMSYKDYKNTLTKPCEEFEEEFSKLQKCDRIFMDSSMIIDKRIIKAGLKIFGEDKILYGSDYPFGFTPKIKEFRPKDAELVKILRNIIDGKKVKDIWKYDYNIYLVIKAIIDAEKSLNLDIRNKIMSENAKRVFKLSR